MKIKTTYGFLALCIFLTISCREEAINDPLQFNNYFQIIDAATGQDWFLTHEDYDPAAVSLLAYDQSNELIHLELGYERLGEKIVFGPLLRVNALPIESYYLLQLNAEDADTLRWVSPACRRCSNGQYFGAESYSFYYNDKLAAQLDFSIDDTQYPGGSIVYTLAGTNNSLTDSTFVMRFEK